VIGKNHDSYYYIDCGSGWKVISTQVPSMKAVVHVNGQRYECETVADGGTRVIFDMYDCRNIKTKLIGYLQPKDIKEAQKGE
jgi:hypothetical protein